MNLKLLASVLAIAATSAGCFYPSTRQPPPADRTRVTVGVPYDLAWDAVNTVVKRDGYRVQAQDANHGIIEAQSPHFGIADADCGIVKSAGGTYPVEPTTEGSAVLRFDVKTDGPEAAVVAIDATYTAPLRAPFTRPTEVECVSLGTREARLLKEIAEEASTTHRPYREEDTGRRSFGN